MSSPLLWSLSRCQFWPTSLSLRTNLWEKPSIQCQWAPIYNHPNHLDKCKSSKGLSQPSMIIKPYVISLHSDRSNGQYDSIRLKSCRLPTLGSHAFFTIVHPIVGLLTNVLDHQQVGPTYASKLIFLDALFWPSTSISSIFPSAKEPPPLWRHLLQLSFAFYFSSRYSSCFLLTETANGASCSSQTTSKRLKQSRVSPKKKKKKGSKCFI